MKEGVGGGLVDKIDSSRLLILNLSTLKRMRGKIDLGKFVFKSSTGQSCIISPVLVGEVPIKYWDWYSWLNIVLTVRNYKSDALVEPFNVGQKAMWYLFWLFSSEFKSTQVQLCIFSSWYFLDVTGSTSVCSTSVAAQMWVPHSISVLWSVCNF